MNAERLIRMTPEEKREARRRAREKGICINCLSNPAAPGPQGGMSLCPFCRERAKVVSQRKHLRDRDERVAGMKERSDRLRAEARCIRCTNPVNEVISGRIPWECATCRAKTSESRKPREKKMRHEQRDKVIEMYGSKCHDCGYGDTRALELHHVNFDGKADGDREGRGSRMVYRILRDGYDPGVVLICANCHRIRHHERNFH